MVEFAFYLAGGAVASLIALVILFFAFQWFTGFPLRWGWRRHAFPIGKVLPKNDIEMPRGLRGEKRPADVIAPPEVRLSQNLPYTVLIAIDAIPDIEHLRNLAFAASWKSPSTQTNHWEERLGGEVAFCFEGHFAWVRFVSNLGALGIQYRIQYRCQGPKNYQAAAGAHTGGV